MIISDLNYVEVVSETSEVKGGLTQRVDTTQSNNVSVGNNRRNGISIGNVGLGLNLNLPTVIGAEIGNFR